MKQHEIGIGAIFVVCIFCKKDNFLNIFLNYSSKIYKNDIFCILQKWRQHQSRAVSYRKTCLEMAPNNNLMSEVHSNASQVVIFEMAPFPS